MEPAICSGLTPHATSKRASWRGMQVDYNCEVRRSHRSGAALTASSVTRDVLESLAVYCADVLVPQEQPSGSHYFERPKEAIM